MKNSNHEFIDLIYFITFIIIQWIKTKIRFNIFVILRILSNHKKSRIKWWEPFVYQFITAVEIDKAKF